MVELSEPWREALEIPDGGGTLQLLYWMHLARRDLAVQAPAGLGRLIRTFATRSPMRPNPIASSLVKVIRVEPGRLIVRGLDCVDGTPLLDIKPEHCPNWRSEADGV